MTTTQVTSAAPGHRAPRPSRLAPRWRRWRPSPVRLGVGLAALLVFSILWAVTIGPAQITVSEVITSIGSRLGVRDSELSLIEDGIVWDLRLPRVLTAAAVGAGLALGGAVMQAVTRNALADPYLLGLSSGASVGAVAALLIGAHFFLPVAAFIGALIALASTLLLARFAGGLTPARTVLAGVAVSALGGALTSLLIFWNASGDSYRDILSWLMGSLSGSQWSSVAIAISALVLVGVPVVAGSGILDAFAFGDSSAMALGINVNFVRWAMLTGVALLTGALVAVSGAIGFIGLVLPHAVRLLSGPGYRSLVPLSALVGALFLVWADTAARTVFDPRELPVGIVTALIGAPVFALILARRKERS